MGGIGAYPCPPVPQSAGVSSHARPPGLGYGTVLTVERGKDINPAPDFHDPSRYSEDEHRVRQSGPALTTPVPTGRHTQCPVTVCIAWRRFAPCAEYRPGPDPSYPHYDRASCDVRRERSGSSIDQCPYQSPRDKPRPRRPPPGHPPSRQSSPIGRFLLGFWRPERTALSPRQWP